MGGRNEENAATLPERAHEANGLVLLQAVVTCVGFKGISSEGALGKLTQKLIVNGVFVPLSSMEMGVYQAPHSNSFRIEMGCPPRIGPEARIICGKSTYL